MPPTCRCARRGRSSPAGTRSATRSRSTGSRSSARSTPTASGRSPARKPGDALFLTKPLGTGLVLHGAQRGLAGDDEVAAAVDWMSTLNRDWADVLRAFRPNAVTDVTGFGLLGHAWETADRSGVRLVLEAESWPTLDGALEVARARREDRRRRSQPRLRRRARRPSGRRPRRARHAGLGPADRRRTAGLPSGREGAGVAGRVRRTSLFARRIGRVEAGAGVLVA